MPQFSAMEKTASTSPKNGVGARGWQGQRVGITGANGELGRALTAQLRGGGAWVVGISHRAREDASLSSLAAQEWVCWCSGEEDALDATLRSLDVLVLNHGVNPGGDQDTETLTKALEINALSHWRLIQLFEQICLETPTRRRELWVNTSEAEIQPALSPGYELSKRLIGHLVSLRWSIPQRHLSGLPNLRKLVLGPFRSNLNPIGVMSATFVAKQVLVQARLGLPLIVVTPNPLTYVLMPLTELGRWLYNRAFRINHPGR